MGHVKSPVLMKFSKDRRQTLWKIGPQLSKTSSVDLKASIQIGQQASGSNFLITALSIKYQSNGFMTSIFGFAGVVGGDGR
jgi:hypothetical protein